MFIGKFGFEVKMRPSSNAMGGYSVLLYLQWMDRQWSEFICHPNQKQLHNRKSDCFRCRFLFLAFPCWCSSFHRNNHTHAPVCTHTHVCLCHKVPHLPITHYLFTFRCRRRNKDSEMRVYCLLWSKRVVCTSMNRCCRSMPWSLGFDYCFCMDWEREWERYMSCLVFCGRRNKQTHNWLMLPKPSQSFS